MFINRKRLPQPWDKKLDSFQFLIVLKCLRPDKITIAMQDFLTKHLGSRFIEPQTSDLIAMYQESRPNVPLIFVLSPGTDPAADLYKFADKVCNNVHFRFYFLLFFTFIIIIVSTVFQLQIFINLY